MSNSTSNIELVARDICARQMAYTCADTEELSATIDRYWHCVAAQLESGEIDQSGNTLISFNLEAGLEAYRDGCRRHPDTMCP